MKRKWLIDRITDRSPRSLGQEPALQGFCVTDTCKRGLLFRDS